MEDEVVELIKSGKISEYGDKTEQARQLREIGWEADEARGVWSIDEPYNMIVDVTKGAQYMQEVKGTILLGYRDGIKQGPIANEQIRGLKVKITDVALHEDPVHRGPAQIMPMTRRAMLLGTAKPIPWYPPLLENIAVFIPISSPFVLTRGPPELPGLMAASV